MAAPVHENAKLSKPFALPELQPVLVAQKTKEHDPICIALHLPEES